MAFVSDDKTVVMILKAILESNIFWKYVVLNSKPYASGYYSLNGMNIKHFGIPAFKEDEKRHLLEWADSEEINNWLEGFYKESYTPQKND